MSIVVQVPHSYRWDALSASASPAYLLLSALTNSATVVAGPSCLGEFASLPVHGLICKEFHPTL